MIYISKATYRNVLIIQKMDSFENLTTSQQIHPISACPITAHRFCSGSGGGGGGGDGVRDSFSGSDLARFS